jgi:hypothetical protein
LIYHALACEADPTQGDATMFSSGDPNWMSDQAAIAKPGPRVDPNPVEIKFQPLPPLPRRHRGLPSPRGRPIETITSQEQPF